MWRCPGHSNDTGAIIYDVHVDLGIHNPCRSHSKCEMGHTGHEGLTPVGAILARQGGGVDCDSPFCIIPHGHGSCPVTHTDTLLAYLGSLIAGELKNGHRSQLWLLQSQ